MIFINTVLHHTVENAKGETASARPYCSIDDATLVSRQYRFTNLRYDGYETGERSRIPHLIISYRISRLPFREIPPTGTQTRYHADFTQTFRLSDDDIRSHIKQLINQ